MNKVLNQLFCLTIFVLLSFVSGCKKDKDEVPYVFVDILLYTTDPAFSPLNAVSGYAYLNGYGSKGILIFRESQTEFMAYDRHCPYKVQDENSVTVDASGLIATDAACGSKFLITNGMPNSGPSSKALEPYRTSFDGTVLHITNY